GGCSLLLGVWRARGREDDRLRPASLRRQTQRGVDCHGEAVLVVIGDGTLARPGHATPLPGDHLAGPTVARDVGAGAQDSGHEPVRVAKVAPSGPATAPPGEAPPRLARRVA